MFTKKSKIITNKENLSNYIDNFDVYNSSIMYKLQDSSLKSEEYLITKFEYRPDLIAEEFYGSTDYLGLLILISGCTLDKFKKGMVLNLIPKDILNNILKEI